MPKVTGIVEGFSDSVLRRPYAHAQLDCGHVAPVALRPTVGRCDCGAEAELVPGKATVCSCGRSGWRLGSAPHPHVAADRLTRVGDTVPCEECARVERARDWLWTLPGSSETVHHSRVRGGLCCLYRRDRESPSGFSLIGCIPAGVPELDDLLRKVTGTSPLSPTEAA